MSAPTAAKRPPQQPTRSRPGPPEAPPRGGADLLALVVCLALLGSALLPMDLLFLDRDWLGPVAGAMLVSLGLAWALQQLRAPSIVSGLVSGAAWLVFVSAVFAPHTTAFGFAPTRDSLRVLRALAETAGDLLMEQAAPVASHPAFLLAAVTGVWAVAFAVTHALARRGRPLAAIAIALVMLSVPMPLAPSGVGATGAVVVFLAAAALCLVVTSHGGRGSGRASVVADVPPSRQAAWSAAGITAVAIAAGVMLADALPGADQPPVYQLRGRGGTTVTTNPMVGLRPSLTAQDRGPALHVTSPRPVYLRTTALDVYDEGERWTTDRIRGSQIEGTRLPPEVGTTRGSEELTVDIEVADLHGVLVPVPYPPVEISGPSAESFQYDARNGTVTVARGSELGPGDAYTVSAGLPPDASALAELEGFAPDSALTALPGNLPPEVERLAREIVDEADASTPFAQALAIQNELRSWEYSLEPEGGHSGDAMVAFLEQRVGYCEQFAGTMAVMLRTLDVPARVAVGFSPGELTDADENVWEITNANAHAWVEVLFPGHGWVAFEPTPRADGNVLVPSAANLAPADTRAGDRSASQSGPEASDDAMVPQPEPGRLEDARSPEDSPEQSEPGSAGAGGGGAEDADGWGGRALGIGAALVMGAAGALALLAARSRRLIARGEPRLRVLRARTATERLARGLGVSPRASDTDAEYLTRVGDRVGQAEAAGALALESARARYAPEVGAPSAARAEEAAARLEGAVGGSLKQAALRARGALSQVFGSVRQRRR